MEMEFAIFRCDTEVNNPAVRFPPFNLANEVIRPYRVNGGDYGFNDDYNHILLPMFTPDFIALLSSSVVPPLYPSSCLYAASSSVSSALLY